jgi:Putative Flp pilus-assembly TadE/G-like
VLQLLVVLLANKFIHILFMNTMPIKTLQKRTLKQRGQSLLWVLGFMATMAVTFAGVYSVGQTTSEKQKIVNAADAAAYTGAMVEARALNLTAYANRADIANEVFLAQMVSMQSWVDYMKTSAGNWKTVAQALSWIPGVAAVASALEAIESALDAAADVIKDVTMPATIFAVEGYYKVMDNALKLVFGTTGSVNMAFATQSAADAVLAANVATQGGKLDSAPAAINQVALGAINAKEWKDAFYRYDTSSAGSASDGRRNTREILVDSRDEFSKERKGPSSLPFSLFFGNEKVGFCPGLEFGVSRDGTTKLKDYDRWEAQDTTEYYVASGAKCKKTGIPMGWGRSTAANDKDNGDSKTDPHNWGGWLAFNDDPKNNEKWTGVKALWDVSRDSNDNPVAAFNPGAETLTFTVAVAKQKVNVRNNEHVSLNFMNTANTTSKLGSADTKADYMDGQISAKSEAKVFFSRPARNGQDFTGTRLFRQDNHKEIANLYNPYWQVRLKNVNTNPLGMSAKDLAKITAIYGANVTLAPFSQ